MPAAKKPVAPKAKKPVLSKKKTGKVAVRKPAARKKSPAKKKPEVAPFSPLYAFVCTAMIVLLALMLRFAWGQYTDYRAFAEKRDAVDRAGFYDGIEIDGLDMSGMTLDAALSALSERDAARRSSLNVTVVCGDRQWTITAESLDYGSNYESVARHAYQVGRGGTLEERYDAIFAAHEENVRYSVSYGYDESLLRASTDAICEEMTVKGSSATVASFDAKSRAFTFTEGKPGQYIDPDALYASVKEAVNAGAGATTVAATLQKTEPSVSTAQLMERYGEIASALTNASTSSSNRLNNIGLALSLINGTRVGPGETFSFNGTVGQRTTARGFKTAGAFENGETTEAVGGGICQVSTTLFNAVVKADLTIVERSPHSRPVAYVDKGKDAAVDWPGTDLKFKNDSDSPVYIVAYLSSDKRVHVSIYGRKLENGVYILVDAVTTETIAPGADRVSVNRNLRSGERVVVSNARTGYRAIAYKTWYSAGGEVLKRIELCKSSYAASPAVIEVGPG